MENKYTCKAYKLSDDVSGMWQWEDNKDYYLELGISVWGNSDYRGIQTKEFESVLKAIDDLGYIVGNHYTSEGDYLGCYDTVADYIDWALPKANGKKYSTKEISKIKKYFLSSWQEMDKNEDDFIFFLLGLATGKKYKCEQITGCCQRDWNYCYYPEDEEKVVSKYLAADYFNLGQEYKVIAYEGDKEVEEVCIYVYDWREEEQRQEIADAFCVSPEDVELYEIDGYEPIYKAI